MQVVLRKCTLRDKFFQISEFPDTLFGTTTNKRNISREKKRGESYQIASALRQGEVKTLQHSDYTFTFDDAMPPSRSLFHLQFVFLVVSAR